MQVLRGWKQGQKLGVQNPAPQEHRQLDQKVGGGGQIHRMNN